MPDKINPRLVSISSVGGIFTIEYNNNSLHVFIDKVYYALSPDFITQCQTFFFILLFGI